MSNESTTNPPTSSTAVTRTLLRDVIRNTSIVGRTSRLPSIRSPRDLTLGSLTRKTYVPNIPVRKKAKSETKEPAVNHVSLKESDKKKYNRPRMQREYVQLPGVMFGEGVSSSSLTKRSAAAEINSQTKTPSCKTKSSSKKKELKLKEEKNDDAYLSDHFAEEEDDNHGEQSFPIVIPMNLPFKDFFENHDLEKNESVEKASKKTHDSIKIKLEKETVDTENSSFTVTEERGDIPSLEKMFSDVKLTNEEPILLLALPTVLTVPSTEKDSVDNELNLVEKPILSNLSSSHVGKLQILKNGCTRLIIGDMIFNGVSDIQTSMYQELVAVHEETWTYHVTELGQVTHTLKFVPDNESMLQSKIK